MLVKLCLKPTRLAGGGRISWRQTFASLQYRNYRLWFFGQMVSLCGTWMQATAQSYLVYDLTRSPTFLGLVGFASGIPSWLLTLYGGVIADRVARRTLLIVTQSIMMLLAFILAALTFSHLVRPWHIILLASSLGVVNAFDGPTRQSFVLEMVERKDLANAIALNSTMFNSATAVGPAVAGLTYMWFGPAWCFIINGISFIAVIVALRFMKLAARARTVGRASTLAELKEGLRYVGAQPIIRTLICLVAATTLFGHSFATLIPAWAVKILGGDAKTNGFLQSARGAGAVGGAILLATFSHFNIKGKLLTAGAFIFPVLLLTFAFVRWLPLSLLALFGVGAAMILFLNLANTMVQTQVPDSLRGRVMGVYTLIFFGSMPLGALWVGTVAERFGLPVPIIIGSLTALAVAVLVWVFIPKLRALP